jgi:radical SAM protein with 4Fe4S-binding SPASM domain
MEMSLSRFSPTTPTLRTLDRLHRQAGFPPFRALLKRSSSPCTLCRNNHLERAMAHYGENRDSKNSIPWLCHLEVLAYQFLLEIPRIWLGVDRPVFRELLSEKHTRHLIVNYLRGFAQFGATTLQPSGAPVILVWEITRSCNLHCVYCHVDADQNPMKDELTRREKLELVQQVAEAGTNALMIAGGEPLTSPDLPEMIHQAHRRGLYTVLITNGTLLSLENALCLKGAGLDYVKVSIDSVSPEIHDALRGKGCWEKAIAGIQNAVDAGIDTGISITATQANFSQMPKIVQMAKNLGCRRIIIFNFVPSGRGGNEIELDLDGEKRRKMLHLIMAETRCKILGQNPLEISTTAPQAPLVADRILREFSFNQLARGAMNLLPYGRIQAGAAFFSKGCSAGITLLSVDPDGSIRPCDMLPFKVGNIREKSLMEIWTKNPVLIKLRNRENIRGWCGHCSIRDICGGCRARAYTYFGDLFGPDPNCFRRKTEGLERNSNARDDFALPYKYGG